MKSFRHLSVIFVAMIFAQAATAQDIGSLFDRLREIRFLESDRHEMRRILYDYNLVDSSDESDEFSFCNLTIEIFYSTGTCDEEEEIWDVNAGQVIRIEITNEDDLKLTSLGIEISKLKKEQKYNQNRYAFIYHDKKRGFAVEADKDDIEKIILFPPVSIFARTCETKFAKEFVSMKSWFGSVKLENRTLNFSCPVANVSGLDLSHNTITATGSKQISVKAVAFDPENDPLVYSYKVSAGKIIGTGPNVIWDLIGVSAGTYTITAAVDDGCGFCGMTQTRVVVIK